MNSKPKLNLCRLNHTSIYNQLQLEEALLRADDSDWCIINTDAPPAIVLGISAIPEQWIDQGLLKTLAIPVIRRFSGGGTVVIDEGTIFVTFICNTVTSGVPSVSRKIMDWSKEIYRDVFSDHSFGIQENDYAFGEKKVGGNAQYLRKTRWLHHTSFLWDFKPERMNCLKFPPKSPSYRKQRQHDEFLCTMKNFNLCKDGFVEKLFSVLEQQFALEFIDPSLIKNYLSRPHRKATEITQI